MKTLNKYTVILKLSEDSDFLFKLSSNINRLAVYAHIVNYKMFEVLIYNEFKESLLNLKVNSTDDE